MSTPTTSRKRKADALEADLAADDTASSAAHLPATCLAAVLNFMEYADVRRCLLAGKLMAIEAARHVEVLNIMNTSELVPPAARRFANVSEVNILSLVFKMEEEDQLSAGTATRAVPFLSSFPKLERAFLGGIYEDFGWHKFSYTHSECTYPSDHLHIFRGLVDHFCGAFQSRLLSVNLNLGGVLDINQLACGADVGGLNNGRKDAVCRRCWNVATSFPLDQVLHWLRPRIYFCGLCLSASERTEAIAGRLHDSSLHHSEAIIRCCLQMANYMLKSFPFGPGVVHADSTGISFWERIESQGGGKVKTVGGQLYFIAAQDLAVLKLVISFIDPDVIGKIPVGELKIPIGKLPRRLLQKQKKICLDRQTFEGLVQIGFALTSSDYVLIDAMKEEALKNFRHVFL